MNKILQNVCVLSLIVVASSTSRAQSSEQLDINNIKAQINVNNFIFHDPVNSMPGFEYPKNSGKHTLFGINLVLLGMDSNNQVAGMIPQLNNSQDLYGGPIMNLNEYSTSAQIWDRVWKINCSSIQTFKDWYQTGLDDAINGTSNQASNFPGYQIPQSILDWPAHGDINKGQDLMIAPFVDTDGDNFYDPANGDYPKIKGDQAIFFVYNDERPNWGLSTNRLEVRVMAYAYGNALDSALNSTVFLNYEIVNRSSNTLDSVYIGMDTDFDLGNFSDDFVGCDVARSSFYAYNGDAFDEDGSGLFGYGTELPAQAVVFLNGAFLDNDGADNPYTQIVQDAIDSSGFVYNACALGLSDGIIDNETFGLTNFMSYGNSGGFSGSPINPTDYYSYASGRWLDGSSLVYGGNGHTSSGGSVPAKYTYPGNSDPLFWNTSGVSVTPSNWSEFNEGNAPSDRKGLGSMGPFTLEPGERNSIDIALVSAIDYSGSGTLAPITILNERIDSIRNYFCNGIISDCESGGFITGLEETEDTGIQFEIYPNPFQSFFTIDYERVDAASSIQIFDLLGKQLFSQQLTKEKTIIDLSNQANGIYFVRVKDGKNSFSQKIIKR